MNFRKLIIFFIFMLLLNGVASAGWNRTITPTDLNASDRFTIGSTNPAYYTTFNLTDRYFAIQSGASSSGTINGTVSDDQYYRFYFNNSVSNLSVWDLGKPMFFLYTNDNYSYTTDPYFSNIVQAPTQNGYTIECGYKNSDPSGRFKIYLNGVQQTLNTSNAPNFTQVKYLDFYINDGRAIVAINGTKYYNLTSIGNVTRADIIQSKGTKYIYKVQSAQSYFAAPVITWSTPNAVNTTQYDDTPVFSFTSDQNVNYTITDGETTINGNSDNYSYTPPYSNYGTYLISFNVSSDSLDDPVIQNYTWNYYAAPLDEAPHLSEISEASNIEIYQYQPLDFSVDVTGADSGNPLPSDIVWALNSTTVQTNSSSETANYTFNSSSTGDYNLTVSSTNEFGSDSKTVTVSVLPNSMTISNMIYTPSGDENGSIITFTASNFTDGILIHGWSPVDFNHTVAGKLYTWNYENGTTIDYQTATADNESLDFNLSVVPEGNYSIKIVSEPTADFSYTFHMSGTQPTVDFTDLSVGGATSILWDLGDGETSTDASPTHTYAAEGVYSVNLTRTNILGTDSKVVSANISSLLLPIPEFTANDTEGFAPVTVQFNDSSINATSWSWNFGDGETSAEQNPIHAYNTENIYTVSLTAYNSAGYDIESKDGYIEVIKSANFTMSKESGTAPLTVKFNDTSINALSWAWDFENDGITDSTAQNPVHTYGKTGSYPAKLTVMTPDGETSMIYYVTVNPTTITTINKLYWFLQSLKFWVIAPAVV